MPRTQWWWVAPVIERFPERARTPAVARAITSPSGMLLAGAGMSVAILGGLPLAGAAVVGALAWGARVAMALPRPSREERVEPRSLREPWRSLVADALHARSRFEQTVGRARPGPLRDRLGEMGARLDHGLRQCWRIACQGDALESALSDMDRAAARRELVDLDNESSAAQGDDRASLERAAQAVRSQLASADRIERVARDARTRLRVLNAQMDEAVARAIELSLTAHDSADLTPLSADVDSLVSELESLRLAMEETTGAAEHSPGA